MEEVGIVGGGVSGLMACKHLIEKGIKSIHVFEARSEVGGVWSFQTLDSTKLQTPKMYYQFSDFPWDSSIKEDFPNHNQVQHYLNSYAIHFNLIPYIKFNAKVVGIRYDYANCKWNIFIQDSTKVYTVDFVILCIGKYSELPYIPDYPVDQGPEIFHGRVLHSMDYASMDHDQALDLIINKKITVVGFQKSAVDIAAQIATTNGSKYPCTLLYKTSHWMVSESFMRLSFRMLNRFAELMVHKPNQGFFSFLLATLLSPLMWIYSKCVEMYLKWIYPLEELKMVPKHGFLKQIASCMFTILPNDFYKTVKEGSIKLTKLQSGNIGFCKNGVIVDGNEVESEVVIFGTGFRSQEKLKNIFISTHFQKLITHSTAPFYRECIHPRIPRVAILGYSDSPSVLFTTEMRSKWLAHLLAHHFTLPTTSQMEKEANKWQKCMAYNYNNNNTGSSSSNRFCASVMLQIYSNDELCKDMGYNPRRKKWFIPELFSPYAPIDYRF